MHEKKKKIKVVPWIWQLWIYSDKDPMLNAASTPLEHTAFPLDSLTALSRTSTDEYDFAIQRWTCLNDTD